MGTNKGANQMNIVLWVLQVLAGLAFFATGMSKLLMPLDKLAVRMSWVNALPPPAVRAIGAIEILGGIGLIVPWLTQILPVLTPLAATGLVITMIGATIMHINLKEMNKVAVPLVLGILVLIIAVGRFSGTA